MEGKGIAQARKNVTCKKDTKTKVVLQLSRNRLEMDLAISFFLYIYIYIYSYIKFTKTKKTIQDKYSTIEHPNSGVLRTKY